MKIRSFCLLFALLCLCPASGMAQSPATGSRPDAVDPELFLLRQALELHGQDAAMFGKEVPIDPHHARVLLRFDRECEGQDVRQLAQLGGMFVSMKEDGLPLGVGRVYRALIPWSGLERLYTLQGLLFAESLWSPTITPPLEVTGPLTGAHQIQQLPHTGFTGKGVTIVDIDSGLDILHPAFFRADGESFSWMDQDGDEVFLGQGQDALDYNKDGLIQPNEALKVLDAVSFNRYTNQLDGRDGLLQTGRDWVYLDLNQNGERDAGAAFFTEDTPAYGEPIFVVDDVNKDGTLGTHERLVQLKTSKIRRFRTGQRIWTRGVNLIASSIDQRQQDAGHGTGVTGIIVGGQPLYHDRHGLATDADVIVSSYDRNGPGMGASERAFIGLEEAALSGAKVVLHEWTSPFSEPLDGSTNLEAAMDASWNSGMVHVSPVGNLNQAGKHAEREMVVGQNLSLPFGVGAGYRWGNRLYPYSVIFGSLQWKGTQTPVLTLLDPIEGSVTIDLGQRTNQTSLGQAFVQTSTYVTSRGNTITSFYVYTQNQQTPLTQGTWTLEVTGITQPSTLVARITDYYSSWGQGIGWTQPTQDRGTIVFPSSADSAFGVAAFGGRHQQADGTGPGDLRGFSGRGPRLDGLPVVDITAPDDPFAPLALSDSLAEAGYGAGWYTTFGGTSGAGPHVAAAMALLIEQDPARTPQQLQDLVRISADAPGPIFRPEDWGAGKLNIYRAIFQEPVPASNLPPVATLQASQDFSNPDDPRLILDATGSIDPENFDLEATFDVDHDGTFDVPWGKDLLANVSAQGLPLETPLFARVEVRDVSGQRHGQLVEFRLTQPEPPMEPEPMLDMSTFQPDMAPSTLPEMSGRDMAQAADMGPSLAPDMQRADTGGVFVPIAPTPGQDATSSDSGCGCGQSSNRPDGAPASLVLLLGGVLAGWARRKNHRL